MTRDDLTSKAIELLNTHTNIAIQAATGVGKSKIAIELCNEISNKLSASVKLLIVVAELSHIENWKQELKKWEFKGNSPTIICYASLKKFRDSSWDVIIFDEAHHLNSEIRLDIFSTLKASYKFFLSATLKDSFIQNLEDICGPITSIKMGLQEAFSADILPEPKIKLIPLSLNKTVYNQEIIEEWGKKEKRVTIACDYANRWGIMRNKVKYPNARLIIRCTEQQKYDYLSEKFLYYKKRYMMTRNEILKNKWLQAGLQRKLYLGLLKTKVAKEIISQLHNERFICFCTNIEQANELGGQNAVHSKKKASLNTIEEFNSGKINSLFAVGMLQEGINLNNIQIGIIIQLDGEERAFIQKFGRTLRAESPVQYIIYYKGTRDEEYLKNALDGINDKYIVTHENND